MKLVYTSEEILAEHDYAAPQVVGKRRLHGGFDSEGSYLSPRTLIRPEAVENWASALHERGGEPLVAGPELLSGPRYPNYAQQKLLLERGHGQSLWNSFTGIGRTEARGRMLAEITPPSFEKIVDGDVEAMTLGHLGKGLFVAHGHDEGGRGDGIGAHDEMWFAVRDLAFGEDRYPLPEVAGGVGMGGGPGERVMPDLPPANEQTLRFLMSLLMIELRAFIIFEQMEELLSDPELFTQRRPEADEAAEVVRRIRADEAVHVAYLRNLFGELRHSTIHCADGSKKPGREVIDPAWERQVTLSTVTGPRNQLAESRRMMRKRLSEQKGGERLFEEFEALADPGTAEVSPAS